MSPQEPSRKQAVSPAGSDEKGHRPGERDPVDAVGGVGAPLGYLAAGLVLAFFAAAIVLVGMLGRRGIDVGAMVVGVPFLAVFYTVVTWAVVQAFGDADVVEAATANPRPDPQGTRTAGSCSAR